MNKKKEASSDTDQSTRTDDHTDILSTSFHLSSERRALRMGVSSGVYPKPQHFLLFPTSYLLPATTKSQSTYQRAIYRLYYRTLLIIVGFLIS